MWTVGPGGGLEEGESSGRGADTTLDLHWENTDGVLMTVEALPERFPYLQWLNLEGQRVSEAGPLGLLLSLRELMISGNQLEDIAPLSSCLLLTKLDVNDNMIQEIPGMRDMRVGSHMHSDT